MIRWRLAPGSWTLSGSRLTGPKVSIEVQSEGPCVLRMAEGWESQVYLERQPLPVLEIEIPPARGSLRTVIAPVD